MSTTDCRDRTMPACDLVMRGGIASGVAYPLAIARLMQHFRLAAIGGASAGAIAAGVAAAAEFGRRDCPTRDVTDALRAVTTEIGAGGGIRRLLRPDASGPAGWIARALWPVLPALTTWLPRIARFAVRWVALPLGIVLVLALVLLWQDAREAPVIRDVLRPVIVAFVLVAVAMLGLGLAMLLSLPASGYGLCSGVDARLNAMCAPQDAKRLRETGALMDWLHAVMQQLAGLTVGKMDRGLGRSAAVPARPLLMGDLWAGDDFRDGTRLSDEVRFGPRKIDLMLTTTNLGQQLAQQFPFLDRWRAPLFFNPEELARVLPRDVVEWMVHAAQHDEAAKRVQSTSLCRLPLPEHLPVLFGIRLSMSFPVLIAAVPLHVEDAQGGTKRVWFSDGGITSNFPVDVFDAPLPRRPTFCLNLRDADPPVVSRDPAAVSCGAASEAAAEQALVIMADDNDPGPAPVSDLKGQGLFTFLSRIVGTARNARENELILTPGYRDRIVEIALMKDEGGLNLGMSDTTIERIAKRGELAAQRLVDRYYPEACAEKAAAASSNPIGWHNQRWIRLRATLAAQERLLADILSAWEHGDEGWGTYPAAMSAWSPEHPANLLGPVARHITPDYCWKDADAAARAAAATESLLALARALKVAAAQAAPPDTPAQGRSVFDGVGDGRSSPKHGVASPRIGLRQRTVGGDPRANMTWRS